MLTLTVVVYVSRFLLGRQQICVPLGFMVAQITAFSGYMDQQLLGPFWSFLLVTIGLPGIVVLLQVLNICYNLKMTNIVGCVTNGVIAFCSSPS